ncbi:MAG: LysR family transcriptional regulator [Verrucomicrobia bacterium]|nr:LysR family transcriptional regulator [Verrucomicrobiota bacterium]
MPHGQPGSGNSPVSSGKPFPATSLTRQIHNLEEELSVRLLDRSKNRVSLTEEGRSFLADAKRLLAQSLESIAAVQRFSRGESA